MAMRIKNILRLPQQHETQEAPALKSYCLFVILWSAYNTYAVE
jgi:hypothetical protein